MPFNIHALHLDDHPALDAFLKAETEEDIQKTLESLCVCQCLLSPVKPTLETLSDIPTFHAYIRVEDVLYYVNTLTKSIRHVPMTNEQLRAFDAEFKPTVAEGSPHISTIYMAAPCEVWKKFCHYEYKI